MEMSNNVLNNLAFLLQRLPGVGPKTSQHFVFFLAKQPKEYLERLINGLNQVRLSIKMCQLCFNYSDSDPCSICLNPRRDKTVVCVVAEPLDILALEKTAEYQGVYHVLGGALNTAENLLPQNLKINELLGRLKSEKPKITELILGLNANLEGETTALYLIKLARPFGVKITRLARGLPQGSDLQYADEVTLANALKGRRQI